MRLVVFFDLPVETSKERKSYRLFRKYLINEGYLMMQESVYSKLVTTEAAASSAIERLRKHRPPAGLVQVLKVTEKQYSTMVYITGKREDHEELDTMDELVVL
ncbi:MAG: CRISPR-associated endonuclease Cas2 [Eggerthellaceae bacterium]|jgi:CRISPR-associated protein Cas2